MATDARGTDLRSTSSALVDFCAFDPLCGVPRVHSQLSLLKNRRVEFSVPRIGSAIPGTSLWLCCGCGRGQFCSTVAAREFLPTQIDPSPVRGAGLGAGNQKNIQNLSTRKLPISDSLSETQVWSEYSDSRLLCEPCAPNWRSRPKVSKHTLPLGG